MKERPRCFGGHNPDANVCGACPERRACLEAAPSDTVRPGNGVRTTDPVEGEIPVAGFHSKELDADEIITLRQDLDEWLEDRQNGTTGKNGARKDGRAESMKE